MDAVERFEIPTPFSIGPVNSYLFAGDGVTLLDPGPATHEAYAEIETNVARHGYAVTDVDRVVVTHPHMDHFGIANRIAEESGAHVLAHADAAERLEDPIGFFDREQEFFAPFLRSMGVPNEIVDTVTQLPESYSQFQEPVSVDRQLAEGDVVDVGVELEALHTPGHSPGSVCLVAPDEGVAFTGDHVLSDVTPNPLLTLLPGSENERTRSLPTYLASLRKLDSVDVDVGYGGHGDPIPDLHGRIRETIEHHREREGTIADILADAGPTTAYRVMQEMFSDLPATEMFPGMSEVIGHLDLLEDDGRVEITDADGVSEYRLSEARSGGASTGDSR